MEMRRIIIALLCVLGATRCRGENEIVVKEGIRDKITEMVQLLSYLNDDEEGIPPEVLARKYGGGSYFNCNGSATSINAFFRQYATKFLNGKVVDHTLRLTNTSVSKTSSNANDRRWTIKGKLLRANTTSEDYLYKPEDATFVVRWNGSDQDFTLLDVTFKLTPVAVYPKTEREYVFELAPGRTTKNLPWTGGKWRVGVRSSYRDVTSYPGIPDTLRTTPYYLTPYTFTAPKGWKVTKEENPQDLTGQLGINSQKYPRRYTLQMTQTQTGRTLSATITQDKRPKKPPFSFDNDFGFYQLNFLYSLKYGLGLNYMVTLEDSRFTFGALVATNFDTYRGLKSWIKDSEYSAADPAEPYTYDANNYRITTTEYIPTSDGYSELMDPNDEAKHYTKRQLYMANFGVHVADWCRFTVGLGATHTKDIHFMEHARAVTVYSFEPLSSNLPQLDDIRVYKNCYSNYYYRDHSQWDFAVRPALDFQIPLTKDNDHFLSLGAGYTIVPTTMSRSSVDFMIGLRWEMP